MKKITVLISGLFFSLLAIGQDIELTPLEELQKRTETLETEIAKQKKLKLTGYIQTQYQQGEKDASLKIGNPNENTEESFSRIGIRRGRIKLSYEENIATGVFQLDLTEKGLGIKDAYLDIKDPWLNSLHLKAGIFDRPFGNEISYSSSRRESPERSTICQTLFPEERDLGVMLVLQAPKSSPWSIVKLEAGLFAGNGIKPEIDSRQDFIGHLSVSNPIGSDGSFGAGVSYYNGSVYQGIGRFAKREYTGFDAQLAWLSSWGLTQLRSEYLFGQHIRRLSGGYVIFIQDIGTLPFSAVLKYDWYDPNTKISGNEIGGNGASKADLSQNTWGLGALWRMNNNLRLQAFYEINANETTANITDREEDLKDNVFTLRLQYKF